MIIHICFIFSLFYLAQSAVVDRLKVLQNIPCSYMKLARQSACHCFIASHAKLFPKTMAEYCHEDYGTDLNRLSPFCVQHVNKNGKFNLEEYLTDAQRTHEACYSPRPNVVSRQFRFDSPFDVDFDSHKGFGASPNYYGSNSNPLHLGPIDLTWNAVYQTQSGPDFYGLGVNAEFPIYGDITGNFGVNTNSNMIRGGDNPNIGFGISVPF
eukprot:TRINITY_DN40155_c0_g1_i1.p1 TRINITY_DN40155_c0_g1~~TRINITY_DN40155_c0_g1_i1.p1  ORF type:complete len:210 (+),score=19.64 TRINITY_DN40155_c0_g1_i1:200-829(+)